LKKKPNQPKKKRKQTKKKMKRCSSFIQSIVSRRSGKKTVPALAAL
jgi:hypothetical protein